MATQKIRNEVLKTGGSAGRKHCRLATFCNTIDMHYAIICLENIFLGLYLSDCLRQVLLYMFQRCFGRHYTCIIKQGDPGIEVILCFGTKWVHALRGYFGTL